MNSPTSFSLGTRNILADFAAVVLLAGGLLAAGPAAAASGPFESFPGVWSGEGTIRLANGNKERIRCNARYRVRGSSNRDIDLQLQCESDNYKFDLTSNFRANESDQISGQWTERTRNIGGSVIGRARGEQIQVHAESSGFAADLTMVTREKRQSVTIDSRGGGERVEASISLRRE